MVLVWVGIMPPLFWEKDKIDRMNLEQVAVTIENTPKILRQLFAGVDPSVAQWRVTPEDWCINEIIGHLIEADNYAFKARILPILGVEMPALPAWNVQESAEFRQDCQKNVSDLLDELESQRQQMAKFVRGIAGANLNRTGTMAPYGAFKASDFVYEWAYHDFDHVKQILEILKKSMWGTFSDTMQYALEN
jgi:hypothetical protein